MTRKEDVKQAYDTYTNEERRTAVVSKTKKPLTKFSSRPGSAGSLQKS
jgi:hypothetical protein